ncbi:MAG TPA: hypothetical protein DCG37_01615 [Lachnospiraceae bacterium]|nr:hypothetical protein [Lachnospiraceae bacterium]
MIVWYLIISLLYFLNKKKYTDTLLIKYYTLFFINEKHTFSFESNKYFNDDEFLMYDNRERK